MTGLKLGNIVTSLPANPYVSVPVTSLIIELLAINNFQVVSVPEI
jgi:hypothetical protein